MFESTATLGSCTPCRQQDRRKRHIRRWMPKVRHRRRVNSSRKTFRLRIEDKRPRTLSNRHRTTSVGHRTISKRHPKLWRMVHRNRLWSMAHRHRNRVWSSHLRTAWCRNSAAGIAGFVDRLFSDFPEPSAAQEKQPCSSNAARSPYCSMALHRLWCNRAPYLDNVNHQLGLSGPPYLWEFHDCSSLDCCQSLDVRRADPVWTCPLSAPPDRPRNGCAT